MSFKTNVAYRKNSLKKLLEHILLYENDIIKVTSKN
jgi:hypothetical protein